MLKTSCLVLWGVSRARERAAREGVLSVCRGVWCFMSKCFAPFRQVFRVCIVFRVCTDGVLLGLFCRSCFVKTGMFCSTCFVSLDDVFRFAGRRVSSKSSVTVVKRNGDERFRKMKDGVLSACRRRVVDHVVWCDERRLIRLHVRHCGSRQHDADA